MKKKIFIIGLLLSSVLVDSFAELHTTWCKEQFNAPSKEYFESEDDYQNFLNDMTILLCGSLYRPIIQPEDDGPIIPPNH